MYPFSLPNDYTWPSNIVVSCNNLYMCVYFTRVMMVFYILYHIDTRAHSHQLIHEWSNILNLTILSLLFGNQIVNHLGPLSRIVYAIRKKIELFIISSTPKISPGMMTSFVATQADTTENRFENIPLYPKSFCSNVLLDDSFRSNEWVATTPIEYYWNACNILTARTIVIERKFNSILPEITR